MKRNYLPTKLFCLPLFCGLIFAACCAREARAQDLEIYACTEPIYASGTPASFRAYFSYVNRTTSDIVIDAVRPANYFTPNPSGIYGGQPATFHPGYHDRVFSIDVQADRTTTWYLSREAAPSTFIDSVTVSRDPALFCRNRVFTYQGRLLDAGAPANGQYDLRFALYDAPTGDAAKSIRLVRENVAVAGGVFTAELDFGASFGEDASQRYLEIAVRPGTQTGNDPFTVLTPRQPLTAAPLATHALTATTATNVAGGFVQLPLTTNAPPSAECEATTRGRMKVDAANNKIWVCAATGWKSMALQ